MKALWLVLVAMIIYYGISLTKPPPNVPIEFVELVPNAVERRSWSRDFLAALNAPAEATYLVDAWIRAEGMPEYCNNPLATTMPMNRGESTWNSHGVKCFLTYEDGLEANLLTINNGLYDNIILALQQDDEAAFVAAIGASPWGTSAGTIASILGE